MTKDKDTGYVFTPGECWNTLEKARSELTILKQPVDFAGMAGMNAVFTTEVTGSNSLTYQWQYKNADVST